MTVTVDSSTPRDALAHRIAALAGDDIAVSARQIDRRSMAHDASHYLLTPDAVVTPRSAGQVARVLSAAGALGRPVTFRSGGSSLSGQAVTDGILVDTRRHFRGVEVLDGGDRVRVGVGTTVRQVNAHLARHGRKLGPDPASEIACTLGGVIADNSSGMACGTEFNTYRTLESMTLVLPSGTVIDTASRDADAELAAREPELHRALARLRDRVRGNARSVATIRRLFAMKNTMGYGLNAFLDFDAPVRILEHLMIGSEGTLGFVAGAVFRTVPLEPCAATGLMVFPTLAEATAALPALVADGLATIELMDATSLRVAQAEPDAPGSLAAMPVEEHAALLVEHQAADADALGERVARLTELAGGLPLAAPFALTEDSAERAGLWHVRKGLYTAVAAGRPSGTNALLEDVAVPVPELLPTCRALTDLFTEHGYRDNVIFGHAKDGNIHFMLNERFDDAAGLERYRAFTEDMVDLVLDAGGVLKAEHGTGRIMAPFVARQYGDELAEVIREVKAAVDPAGVLNPGVIVAAPDASYTENLKTAPRVEEEVDRCVECGYCEPVCPSRDLTTTPRQRIVLRREIAAAEERGDAELAAQLRADFEYDGVETCAVDGMCMTACPVQINTGDLVRRLRAENRGTLADAGWAVAARGWGGLTRSAGTALTIASHLPKTLVTGATKAGRAVVGADTVPLYDGGLPGGGSPRARLAEHPAVVAAGGRPRAGHDHAVDGAPRADAVYFPACIGTMFGPEPSSCSCDAGGCGACGDDGADGTVATMDAFLALAERAGVRVVLPTGIGGLCCGTPWKSKGMLTGYRRMLERTLRALWEASAHGALPVVCDASSCTEGLATMLENAAASPVAGVDAACLRIVDAVDFVHERMLPALTVTRRLPSVVLHPTCSATHLGSIPALDALAAAICDEVITPVAWGCCGFAGDRGMLHPELTASATAPEAAEVAGLHAAAYASTNRTCELGMTRATGRPYRNILELVERATRPDAAAHTGATGRADSLVP